MHSFFPNTVRLWNKLPLVVKSSTNVDTLKQRLQHITLRSSYDYLNLLFQTSMVGVLTVILNLTEFVSLFEEEEIRHEADK